MPQFALAVAIIFAIIIGLSIFTYFVPIGLWITAIFSGVRVGIGRLIGMRLRKVPPANIIKPLITAQKAGIDVAISQLEAHYMAGGNVQTVVNALISAEKAHIKLDFDQATAIDLAGRNVFEAVQVSVNPKVISVPPVAAIAKNGIQVVVKCKVTVRANINRLVGGAGEETIIARVGEGIVTTIGSAESHEQVLENPDSISKTVLGKSLDSGTAYEILSIDIADIDVGENIGAKLQAERAEADLKIARAKAEERRAMAIAKEHEMLALAQEMRAKVIEAESQLPIAMAEAFRKGYLGVMDYYKMKNIQADTEMRISISEGKNE